MGKRIKSYRLRIDSLLSGTLSSDEARELLAEHLQQIAFFQHERLVHLIVTMTVAVLLLLCAGITLMTDYLIFGLVFLMLLILFVPYIFHYALLENELQRMYGQYDRLLLILREKKD